MTPRQEELNRHYQEQARQMLLGIDEVCAALKPCSGEKEIMRMPVPVVRRLFDELQNVARVVGRLCAEKHALIELLITIEKNYRRELSPLMHQQMRDTLQGMIDAARNS